jgi:hypothetical protein
MPLDREFFEAAEPVFDAGMGTENVGPLLYALVRMRRPKRVLAVGLGYSTLFLLKALGDAHAETIRDRAVLAGQTHDPARRSVLVNEAPVDAENLLIGVDDFSDDQGRLARFQKSVSRIGCSQFFELRRQRYQELQFGPATYFGFVWIDCGHQVEYAELCNCFWPLVESDGGLFAMHYTHVDLSVPEHGNVHQLVIPGPWVNAAKRQLIEMGLNSDAEILSIVEPHKVRQGSLTLLRKLDAEDRCRHTSLREENLAIYGKPGMSLAPLCSFGQGNDAGL